MEVGFVEPALDERHPLERGETEARQVEAAVQESDVAKLRLGEVEPRRAKAVRLDTSQLRFGRAQVRPAAALDGHVEQAQAGGDDVGEVDVDEPDLVEPEIVRLGAGQVRTRHDAAPDPQTAERRRLERERLELVGQPWPGRDGFSGAPRAG